MEIPELCQFTEYLKSRDRSTRTISGYAIDIRCFVRWLETQHGEAYRLTDWQPEDIKRYREYLTNEKKSKATTSNRNLAAICAYGEWAEQAHRIERNPARHIRSVAIDPLAPKWLDKDQRNTLLKAVRNDLAAVDNKKDYPRMKVLRMRDATAVIVLLGAGLRVGELCALRLGDVQISERKGSLTVRNGKGLKQRTVPLNKDVRDQLEAWLMDRPPDVEHDYVFTGQRGGPMKKRSVLRALSRLAKKAGLDGVTPHTLRHSFARSLVDAGEPLENVAALLGHSSINTTRIYTVPGEIDLERAVEKLETTGETE